MKDHLPQDIITILERLGKVENTPFDKLYYLAENCADHYCTSIIKTFVEIVQRSATDRQIVLVNTARALKYLEDFRQRQFDQKLTTEQDTVQLNAPDFDLDIDGPNIPRAHNNTAVVSVQDQLTSPEPELSDAMNFQEETTDRDPPNATYNNSEESHGHDNFTSTSFHGTTPDHFKTQHQFRRNPPTRRGLGQWPICRCRYKSTDITHILKVRELERITLNINLICQTINIILNKTL